MKGILTRCAPPPQRKAGDPAKLDVRSAAKITRYSKALLEILSYESDERKEAKKKLSKLSQEELDALAKKEGLK